MMRLPLILGLIVACDLPIGAQQPQAADLSTLSGGMRSLYLSIRRNILEAAELMPESEYPFRAAAEVRSFGQLIGHLANTQYNFCAAARGVRRPAIGDLEKLAAKADLVKALKASLEFCDPAYDGATDADLSAPATFGSAAITKGYALAFNIAHDNEHYGNIVTYLRLKGLVPPSTARTIK
jgi:uncharacterized damage-inducible protein DinB